MTPISLVSVISHSSYTPLFLEHLSYFEKSFIFDMLATKRTDSAAKPGKRLTLMGARTDRQRHARATTP